MTNASRCDVFDFFCGCGGTSVGLQAAGHDIRFGLDCDRDSIASFRANFPSASAWQRDIRAVSHEEIIAMYRPNHPTLFVGCAPCQPFSKQNRSRGSIDARRNLLAEFGRIVVAALPDYVLVENVPGLQQGVERGAPLRRFRADLTRAGYDLGDAVLHASVFGVPQRRARYLLIGSRRGRVELPSPTHGPGLRPYSTVRDWIGGLPPLRAGQSSSKDSSHCASALSPENMKRIQCTPEGGGRESWPKKLLLACHQQTAGHSDVYGRLAFAGLAAALTTRCISYSNGRFGHPRQHRAITPREAGCLQTFPRTHVFVGSITSQAKQIGNAVPPLVAQRLGEAIASHIDQLQRTSVRGRGTSRSAPRP